MGNNLDQYRAHIGAHYCRSVHMKSRYYPGFCHDRNSFLQGSKNLAYITTILLYLMTACPEINPHPGPNNVIRPTICHANIYSLKHGTRFESICTQLAGKFDVITLSETWLQPHDSSDKFKIPGYTGPYRLDRPTPGGGWGTGMGH